MDTASIQTIINITWQMVGGAAAIIGVIWAAHKFYLSTVFVTKKEFVMFQTDLEDKLEKALKPLEQIIKQEKDFAVFKAEYKGDSALLKEQMGNMREMSKQTLNGINNLQSVNVTKLIDMAVENYVKKIK